jgi:uncharacterized repeat protein (TIGR01451 family)
MSNSIPKHKHIKIRTISLLALTIALIALVSTASTVSATYVSLNKQHLPDITFNPGDTITFTITLKVTDTDGGPAIAIRDLSIIDTLPLGLTYAGSQSSTPTAISFTQSGVNGEILTWDFGVGPYTTAPQAVVSFTVTVNTGVTGYLQNHAVANYIEAATDQHSTPGITDSVYVNPPPPTPSPTTPPTPGPTLPPTVGGEFAPVSILQLLAPYLVVAFIGAAVIASLVMYRKRTK